MMRIDWYTTLIIDWYTTLIIVVDDDDENRLVHNINNRLVHSSTV